MLSRTPRRTQEKAAFVQQTLPNEASEWKPKSWRALSEEQRGVVAQRVFEESKHAKQAPGGERVPGSENPTRLWPWTAGLDSLAVVR